MLPMCLYVYVESSPHLSINGQEISFNSEGQGFLPRFNVEASILCLMAPFLTSPEYHRWLTLLLLLQYFPLHVGKNMKQCYMQHMDIEMGLTGIFLTEDHFIQLRIPTYVTKKKFYCTGKFILFVLEPQLLLSQVLSVKRHFNVNGQTYTDDLSIRGNALLNWIYLFVFKYSSIIQQSKYLVPLK